ncbi:MAG TPA: transporter [Caulobacteraceae bacterium]|jgi:hypothetical protein
MRTITAGLGAGALALLAASPAGAAEPTFRFTTGFDYSSGDFGETVPTEVLYVPFTGRATFGRWTFRATVPYLEISGPANVVVGDEGGGGETTGAPGRGPRRTVAGLGDTTLAATYSFNRLRGTRAYLDLSGRLRLPTGDEDTGLGVGAVDTGVNSELGWDGPKGGAYLNLGRRFLGDSDRFKREDGWTASTGGWVNATRRVQVGSYYSWREASLRNGTDPQELGAYFAYRFSRQWRVQLTGYKGLSDGSPDVGAAVSISFRPRRANR